MLVDVLLPLSQCVTLSQLAVPEVMSITRANVAERVVDNSRRTVTRDKEVITD